MAHLAENPPSTCTSERTIHDRLKGIHPGVVNTPELHSMEGSRSSLRARLVIAAMSQFRLAPVLANQLGLPPIDWRSEPPESDCKEGGCRSRTGDRTDDLVTAPATDQRLGEACKVHCNCFADRWVDRRRSGDTRSHTSPPSGPFVKPGLSMC